MELGKINLTAMKKPEAVVLKVDVDFVNRAIEKLNEIGSTGSVSIEHTREQGGSIIYLIRLMKEYGWIVSHSFVCNGANYITVRYPEWYG